MAALLVTTSAITLPFMVSVSDNKLVSFKFLNDIFWFIGLLSLITSSLLIDSILDDEDIDFKQRLGLMGYGYLIFSVLVSVMSVAVTVLFIDLEMDQTKIPVLSIPFLPILLGVVGGIFLLIKLMTNNDHGLGLAGISVCFPSSYLLIKFPCIWL